MVCLRESNEERVVIGSATVEAFQNIAREQQERIIMWLREEGASVRQIVRYTGYTTKQVGTLTDNNNHK